MLLEILHRFVSTFLVVIGGLLGVTVCFADEPQQPAESASNYEEHIAPLFKKSCATCHGDGKQEAGLSLANYASMIKGSGGGEIVIAGRSSASRLLEVITSTEDGERMPPDGEPLSADAIALIQNWIDTGLKENAGSSAAAMRTLGFKPVAAIDDGSPGSLPQNLPEVKRPHTLRPFPILALAASPRAAVAASSAYGAVELFDPRTLAPFGAIEFVEGEPLVLSFSRSGRLLLAAGGKPVQNGVVALFDVATGKRLATIGDEPDAIIAADISPDEKLVAIGCTSRLVKIYSTEDGSLVTTINKHTDWITTLSFSPDGRYLVTGDRIGNIHLWDGQSGGVILPLAEHTKAVRALSWRSDAAVVASCGEDGKVVWWDVKDGWPLANKPNAHAEGVLDCRFGPGGQLVSCGRDGRVKVWSAEGNEVKSFAMPNSSSGDYPVPPGVRRLPTRVIFDNEGKTIVAGDSMGQLHTWAFP